MADRRSARYMELNYFLLCNFVLLCPVIICNDSNYPSRLEISKWASDLDLRLTSSLEKISGISVLEESFGVLGKAKLVAINGAQLVNTLSAELTKHLKRKMDALQRLVVEAEKEVANYKYEQTLSVKEVSWINVKNFTEDDPRLEFSEKFRKGIYVNESGVHIPIEIFEGYPEIVNGLSWSKALDKTFQENSKNDSSLLWQYFGSQTGFMRTYPATKWPTTPGYPDLFDVRRRPWYIHGSSSPKDMMILMDISGSMHGQTMEIMKIAVKTLLNTLGEDDFVNIASFTNETDWVSCFKTFVQATRRNKMRLFKDIEKLKDGNMASLSNGLKFAFMQFESFEKNRTEWEGANCHKVIVVFTDGGTEEAGEVLKKYNADKKVRIFTFAVGPHPVPYATVKEVACASKGYFSSVPSMGATRIRVQDYVKVLSRPMVLSNQKEFQWTNFYLDVSGLGVLTTVTLPVFNRSNPNNDTMVGVMGVDVTVQELMEKEPRYQMGPGGYSFAVNHNGLIVYHPDLAVQIKNRLKTNNLLDDSPHTDFLDLEVENDARNEVRTAMINKTSGMKIVTGVIELPDMKHAVIFPLKYFYTPIDKTQFSLGVAMLVNRTHYIQVEQKRGVGVQGLGLQEKERYEIHLAPWKYCHDTVLVGNMSNIFENISTSMKRDMRKCDKLLLERMIWDIDRTRTVVNYWKKEDANGRREGVIASFVSTDGGVTRIYPYSDISSMGNIADPRQDLFYERALYGEDLVFLLPRLYESANDTRVMVTYVKAIRLMDRGQHYVPGVVGAILDEAVLQNILRSTPSKDIPGSKTSMHCGQTDSILCYLLDDGGFVIASNQVDQPFVAGSFLGDYDPALMHELHEKEIYKRIERYNYEDYCPKPRKANSGSRMDVWSLHVVVDVFNWFWKIIFWLCAFLWPSVHSVPEFAIYVNDNRSCTTVMARYYVENKQEFASNYTCNEGRTRHYSVATVGQTNLLLLVTNEPFLCRDKPAPVQSPREVELTDECTPDIAYPQVKYRRRPGKCYAHHPNDNSSECGSAAFLSRPDLALFIGLLWSLISYWLF